MTMDAKKYIIDNWGDNWLKTQWEAGDVQDALEEYAKLYHEAKLKEELMGFNNFMNTRGYPFICMNMDVDEYLKQRNNERQK